MTNLDDEIGDEIGDIGGGLRGIYFAFHCHPPFKPHVTPKYRFGKRHWTHRMGEEQPAGKGASEGPRLLESVRDAIRRRHYSLRTEESYVHWIWRFVHFFGKRHPRRWARRR